MNKRLKEMQIIVEQGSDVDELKKAIAKLRQKSEAKVDLKKFVGILPKKENPINFQRRLRDES